MKKILLTTIILFLSLSYLQAQKELTQKNTPSKVERDYEKIQIIFLKNKWIYISWSDDDKSISFWQRSDRSKEWIEKWETDSNFIIMSFSNKEEECIYDYCYKKNTRIALGEKETSDLKKHFEELNTEIIKKLIN